VAYRVEVGLGIEPAGWVLLGEERTTPVEEGLLAAWQPQGLAGQIVTVRLTVWGIGEQREARIVVRVE